MLKHLTVPVSKLEEEISPLLTEGWTFLSHSHPSVTYAGWEPRLSIILYMPTPHALHTIRRHKT